MTDLDAAARQRLQRFLATVDAAVPRLVAGVYLTGSTVLDDYRPGLSDIDLLVITSRTVGADDTDALIRAHHGAAGEPVLDGVYLDRQRLATVPDDEPVVPHVVGGQLHLDRRCGELNPVLWLTLARGPVAVRPLSPRWRPPVPDAARVCEWSLGNLRGYWRSCAQQAREAMGGRAAAEQVSAEATVWMVLGAARLHHTLRHQEVVSKSAAARYVARQFPRWTGLAARAARWRAGERDDFVAADALAAADLVDTVIADAENR